MFAQVPDPAIVFTSLSDSMEGVVTMSDLIQVPVEKLVPGMYVTINLSWLKHPFAFNSFLIKSQDEINTIRSLGLKEIQVDPGRSKLPVLPSEGRPAEVAEAVAEVVVPAPVDLPEEKRIHIERNKVLRESISVAEKKASHAARQVRAASKQFISQPAEALATTEHVISDITESLLGNSDVMVHLMSDKVAGEEIYFHSLNVAMLSLLLGKALKLDVEHLQTIGVASIFHDIGKEDIPSRVLLKMEPLTNAETLLLRQHPELGAKIALQGKMPPAVVAAIWQHHENADGSGYPHGLAGEKITLAAKTISIANYYDNLCNPLNPANAMTPYEALATMFAKRKGWFDTGMLSKFVHMLGVYPPGSLVRLSNGCTGLVTSVNTAKPLQPNIMIYDSSIPRTEAIILDLELAPEVSISKALRPGTLAPSVLEYLCLRKRTSYFFGDPQMAA